MMRFDNFLLMRVFAPVAYWYEHRTGETNFRLAYYGFGIAVAADAAWIYLNVVGGRVSSLLLIPLDFFWIMLAIGAARHNEKMRGKPYRTPFAPSSSAITARLVFVCLFTITAVVVILVVAVARTFPIQLFTDAVYDAGVISGLYFLSVPQPPPRRQRQEAPSHAIPDAA